MIHNVVTPSVGESITEVGILKWHKADGEFVRSGDVLLEIESDKATVEVVAEHSGKLKILKEAGTRLPIGVMIATIDDSVQGAAAAGATPRREGQAAAEVPAPPSVRPGASPGPAARKLIQEKGIESKQVAGTGKGGRITKGDVLQFDQAPAVGVVPQIHDKPGDRRVPMTLLRARIAERLLYAQNTAAILTTFNEVDMSAVMALRNKHKDSFKEKYGVSLGFMSFFAKSSIEALKLIPEVNASLDGNDIVYHDYVDMGVAVGTERGLVVPVVRGAEKCSFPDIEKKIAELALKARDGKLSVADLSGGTFTISNGGVYGSLLSTPILNPPQSGILGMHKIEERPVAVGGRVEIRPMMYLALSYDHRLIDGKGAVTFLVHVKNFLENPETLKFEY